MVSVVLSQFEPRADGPYLLKLDWKFLADTATFVPSRSKLTICYLDVSFELKLLDFCGTTNGGCDDEGLFPLSDVMPGIARVCVMRLGVRAVANLDNKCANSIVMSV